jgi:SAM-dependent methyltransferase
MRLDAVLFSLSFNTMPHHRAVLQRAWDQLRPGGRLVIMDAKVPPGFGGRLVLPFSLWLMKHTMLGNPLIHPWEELAAIAEHVDISESMFGSYYVCSATKPLNGTATGNCDPGMDYRIAAE